MLQFAEQFHCDELESKCKEMIKQLFTLVVKSDAFLKQGGLDILDKVLPWDDLNLSKLMNTYSWK